MYQAAEDFEGDVTDRLNPPERLEFLEFFETWEVSDVLGELDDLHTQIEDGYYTVARHDLLDDGRSQEFEEMYGKEIYANIMDLLRSIDQKGYGTERSANIRKQRLCWKIAEELGIVFDHKTRTVWPDMDYWNDHTKLRKAISERKGDPDTEDHTALGRSRQERARLSKAAIHLREGVDDRDAFVAENIRTNVSRQSRGILSYLPIVGGRGRIR